MYKNHLNNKNTISIYRHTHTLQTRMLPTRPFPFPKRMTEQEARADKLKEKNECDIPFCENYTTNYYSFDTKSIKCMQCGKCFCEECCDKIWKGEWDDETFAKPKLVCPFLKHEIFTCPFCRASFDRMTPCEEED